MTAADYAALLDYLQRPPTICLVVDSPGCPALISLEEDPRPEDPRSLLAVMRGEAGWGGCSPTVLARCLYLACCEMLPAIEFAVPADSSARATLELTRAWLLGTTPGSVLLLAMANRMVEADIPLPNELSAPALICALLPRIFLGGHYVWRPTGQRITSGPWAPRFARLVPVHDVQTAEIVWADLPAVPEPVEPVVEAIPVAHVAAEHRCRHCAGGMSITADGVSHHLHELGGVDHDRDADHVAVAEVEPDSQPTPRRRRKPRRKSAATK